MRWFTPYPFIPQHTSKGSKWSIHKTINIHIYINIYKPLKFKIPFLFFHSNSKFPSLPLKHQRSNTTVLSLLRTPTTPLSLTNTTIILSLTPKPWKNLRLCNFSHRCRLTDIFLSTMMALQPTMAFKGPMPPNTLRVSNIDEGVFKEDLQLLFSAFGRLEWIKFQTSTCTLVKFINFYNGEWYSFSLCSWYIFLVFLISFIFIFIYENP